MGFMREASEMAHHIELTNKEGRSSMTPLTPDTVLAQITAALPEDCRPNVIIIGSLGINIPSPDPRPTARLIKEIP